MPRLAGAGSRCHNKSNTLRQQQQQLAEIFVQVPPNNCVAAVWLVVVAVPLGYITRFFGALFSIFSPQRSFVLYYLTCDRCLRFRGCPAELGIELSVSARMICYERKQHGQGQPSAQYSYFLLQQYTRRHSSSKTLLDEYVLRLYFQYRPARTIGTRYV